jgi:hypothetical protein
MPAHRKYFDLPAVKTCPVCEREFPRPANYGHDRWFKAEVCSLSCASRRGNALLAAKRGTMEEQFMPRVDKTPGQGPKGDCWQWTGSLDNKGYGRLKRNRKTVKATHVALELDGRPLAAGQMACHTCDNPPCVRPDHLHAADHEWNMRDKADKGRQPHGSDHPHSKLTAAQVLEIRADPRAHAEVAQTFGVSKHNIIAIRAGKTWKHVA